MNESTKKLGDVFENGNQQKIVPVEFDSDTSEDDIRPNIRAPPNITKSTVLTQDTSGSLMKSHNFLKLEQDDLDKATIFGVPVFTLGCDRLRIKDNVCELTSEKQSPIFIKVYF